MLTLVIVRYYNFIVSTLPGSSKQDSGLKIAYWLFSKIGDCYKIAINSLSQFN